MRVFAIFPLHLSNVLRLPRKIGARSYEVLCLSRKIIAANLKICCSKMQPLSGNQRPGPHNISDEHVSCTAPATKNASLRILFKCPTPADRLLETATKPSRVCSLLTRCTIPMRLPRKTTSERPKVLRTHSVFCTF